MLALAFLPSLAPAKRIAPANVEAVIHEGVRYLAPNDDGRRAYIEAWNVQTNKKLWDLTIFTNRIDPKLEEDIQWVFIETLTVRDGMLLVKSERGDTYQVDLKVKAVTQSGRGVSQAPQTAAQLHDIPETVKKDMTNGSLVKEYKISFQIEPFYLRGDFNGDGKIDLAALVNQRSTGKLGIVIVHGGTSKLTILGAGTGIGNGGDDFGWMDVWQVYSKTRAAHATGKTGVPQLRGDALLVGKSESASGLIYWNGKRYAWFQQGD
jgi:hypothetical protein